MSDRHRPGVAAEPAAPLAAEDRETLLEIARRALADHFGLAATPPPSGGPTLRAPRAAFVTLTRRDTGKLRGCRGEVVARRPLAESVARMAVAAAADDPRFPPVAAQELPLLRITINALTPLTPITADEIEVGRHGLMLAVAGRSGLLLPEVPVQHRWDAREFLAALCRKAGVPAGAWRRPDAHLTAFEAEVWSD